MFILLFQRLQNSIKTKLIITDDKVFISNESITRMSHVLKQKTYISFEKKLM